MPTDSRTASLYVRLSKEARETNLSLTGMMDEVRALAADEGYAVVAEHTDEGISGAVRDRPAFRAWLDDAIQGRADALLTFHADRLTREGVNAAALILDVVEGKDPATGRVIRTPVRLRSVDGLDSNESESFRWRFVIAAEVARAERERIKARNVSTAKRLRKAGRYTGGGAPFGTTVTANPDGAGKVLVRDSEEGALLDEVAARLIRGDSLRAVCRWLNVEAGARTRRGLEWTRSSLLATLRSTATRELVLDLSTRRAVLAVVGERNSTPRKAGRPQTALLVGGLAVCGSCGGKMTTSRSLNARNPYWRYRCASTSEGRTCPAPVSIDVPRLDDWITTEALRRFGHFAHLEPRIVLSGAEDLDQAERALESAQAVLLQSPSPEALGEYQRAQVAFEAARALPQTREEILVETGRTIRDEWNARDVPGRAELLADFLGEEISVHPAAGARGRHRSDVSDRLTFLWRGEIAG